MSFNPSSPVTGGAQTGFTSPTYTLSIDQAVSVFSKQYYVSALGGTQAGVTVHSASLPFTVSAFRPPNISVLGAANPVTGVIRNVPKNKYKWKVRKGVYPAANQAIELSEMTLMWDIPAGSDSYDAANLKAQCSLMIGILTQLSAEIGNTALTGVL